MVAERLTRGYKFGMDDDSDADPAIGAEPSNREPRREFGGYVKETRAIQDATTEAIAAVARSRVHELIPEDNVRQFMHGTGWSSPASPELGSDEMIRIEHVSTVNFSDIADHELSIISAAIREIANGMADKQIENMFQSVSKACDRSGNTVDAAQRSFPDAFMEMLEKIEFGVCADGEVSMPTVYVGPKMGDKIVEELKSQPPEYQARAEALIEEKKAAALAKEEARLSRFRTADE
jgi:hypothetical protein